MGSTVLVVDCCEVLGLQPHSELEARRQLPRPNHVCRHSKQAYLNAKTQVAADLLTHWPAAGCFQVCESTLPF